MSFEPPDGILDIGNATLRVGKLEVAETSGLNQGLQNIIKNDLLITENTEYTTDQKWGLKLPTTWVAEFEVKGHSGKYIDFNFYNENSASNAQGYNLTFMDTTMTLRYDGGSALGGGAATIPTIVNTYRKVNIFFERGVISVSIDGTRYLYHKESDGFNQGLGVASRVVSATGSAFVNVFIEQDASNSAFKNLRIVNGRFISDKTSNIAFIGGNLGVGVNSPKETLDIRGNMHFNRVSNVSQISVDSNVVTEYTGPHDRPLRKYPEVALTANSDKGYVAIGSSNGSGSYPEYTAFDGVVTNSTTGWASDGTYASGTGISTFSWNGSFGEYLSLELPKALRLQKMFLKGYEHSGIDYQNAPRDIKLYGSNNETNWVLLKTETDLPIDSITNNSTYININATEHYKYIRLQITKTYRRIAAYTRIGELEYYGHEEGSGSLDTTLKTVYNVPATTGTQLEVYYDAKGESTVQSPIPDLSPNTNTGAVSGHSPTLDSTDGIDSFKFNGSSQYVTGAHGLTTGSGPVHTISLWLNATEMTNYTYAVQLGQGGTSHQQSAIMFYENKISHAHWGSGVLSDITIAKNVWYHVVAVFTGGNGSDLSKHKIFINGEDGRVGPFPGSTDGPVVLTGTQLTLGRKEHAGGTPGDYFNGSIANFRLYSKALNADQVKELYDYQKDYFLGSKSQVTLYKGHLGVGVTEPSGQLELAGDERIQEYPPGPISGYETLVEGHGVFCAYASHFTTGYNPTYMSASQYVALQVYAYRVVYRPNTLLDGSYGVFYYNPSPGGNADITYSSVFSTHHTYISAAHTQMAALGIPITGAFAPPNCPATELWIDMTSGGAAGLTVRGVRYATAAAGNIQATFNKNDALTDYWESAASTYTSTSGGSPAVSTSGSERLASNTPYGSWVTLKLPYEICLKSYEFTGAGTKSPKEGQIWGSTDGTTWSHVHTFTGGVADVKNNETVSGNTNYYSEYAFITTKITGADTVVRIVEIRYFGTPGPTTLDKGSLTLGRSLDVPRISRYDVDTETPRPEKLVLDFDTTVNSSPTDISGKGNHGTFYNGASYSAADKAFDFDGTNDYIKSESISFVGGFNPFTISFWVNVNVNTGHIGLTQYGVNGANDSIGIKIVNGQDEIEFFFYSNDVRFTWTPVVNRWYHLVANYDGGTDSGVTGGQVGVSRKIWVDGVELLVAPGSRATAGTVTQPSLPANSALSIGARIDGTEPVNGKISNFKFYNVALELSEVKKLYNLGRTGRSMVISDTAVGIGKVPEAQLDVRGIIKGQSPAVFSAKANAAMTATAAGAIALFGTVITDTAGGWDSVNHRYYAKVPGFYIVNAAQFTIVTTNVYVVIRIDKNGVEYSSTTGFAGPGGYPNTSLTALIYLEVGDYVRCRIGTDTNRTTASSHRLEIVHVGM